MGYLSRVNAEIKRRHPDSNWGIKALQASALPLGHAAIHDSKISGRRDSDPRHSAWKADALPTELLPRRNEVFTSPIYYPKHFIFARLFLLFFL